jgi:hypothetical protein
MTPDDPQGPAADRVELLRLCCSEVPRDQLVVYDCGGGQLEVALDLRRNDDGYVVVAADEVVRLRDVLNDFLVALRATLPSYADRIRAGLIDPWVGEGVDGARRSCAIALEEVGTLDFTNPQQAELAEPLRAQAAAWEALARRWEAREREVREREAR